MSSNDTSPTAHATAPTSLFDGFATAPTSLFKALSEPFPEHDLEWRVGSCGSNNNGIWARVVPYLTNRAIQDRLDHVVGPHGWKNRFEIVGKDGAGILCGLSIKIDGEWIEKVDGAEITDVEPFKGGLSGAMKRAAVQWGIGRFLYGISDCWADIHEKGAHRGKTSEGQHFRWDPPRLNLSGATPVATNPVDHANPTPAAAEKPSAAAMQVATTETHPTTTTKTPPTNSGSGPTKDECDQLYWELISDKGLLPAKEYKPLVFCLFKHSPSMKDRYANLTALIRAVKNIYSAMGPVMGANMLKDITLGSSIDRNNPSAEDAGEWLHNLVHTSETGELLTGMEKKP